jgi:hypothetical protein
MKITDLIVEQQLDEKPMGALSGIGNKIASKFGSGKAMGKLDTGKIANDLRKQFDVYLGKTGQQADAQVIIDFLSSMGLPTDAVNASSAAATTTTTAPAKDMKSTLGIGKNAGQPMATPNQPKRVDPTLDPSAPMPAARCMGLPLSTVVWKRLRRKSRKDYIASVRGGPPIRQRLLFMSNIAIHHALR